MTRTTALRINNEIAIPRSELLFTFVRSSGPGGQNVNKVASKAVLRWNAAQSKALPDAVRARLMSQVARRLTESGELVLNSQRYRDQARNIDDCLAKLTTLVLAAARRPKPRRKTKPTKASREARIANKRATANKKQQRKFSPDDA